MGKEKDNTTGEEETFPDLRFGPLDYAVSKIQSYLSPEQKDTLQQFRDSIPTIWPDPLTGIEELFLSDATLCRYLRARDWNLGKAQKMLVETLKWRREYKPWAITAEDVDIELNNPGKMYRSGFDKYQRPILIMKPRKDNTGDSVRDIKVKYLVYCLEKCLRAGDTIDREKIALLIDFSNYSQASGLLNIRMSLDVLSILSNHYPERLGTAWILGASWSFTLFWRAVSPFLDPVTKNKIFFVKNNKELLDWIAEDVLEVEYGGTNTYEYNYEIYKTSQDRLFPPHNEAGELVILFPEENTETAEGTKKKKKKKSKKTDENVEANEVADSSLSESNKSKKGKSHQSEDASIASEDASAPAADEESSKKKKKKKESKQEAESSTSDAPVADEEQESTPKKEKKPKKPSGEQVESN